MLSFLKKIFGAKSTEASPAPYKVETPAPMAPAPGGTPLGGNTMSVAPAVKKAAKKPAVKKTTTRKPRAPKV